jgi:hypothetical protein
VKSHKEAAKSHSEFGVLREHADAYLQSPTACRRLMKCLSVRFWPLLPLRTHWP